MIKNSYALSISILVAGLLLTFNYATAFFTRVYLDWSWIGVACFTVYFAVLGYEEHIRGYLHETNVG